MSEEVRMQRLVVAMRAISIFFVSAFLPFLVLAFLDSPILGETALLGRLLRWEPHNQAYEGMVAIIYVVWGFVLWRASSNPRENRLFIDFTIWANLAHAAIMLVSALVLEEKLLHLVLDVPTMALIGAVLLWLRPRVVPMPA